MTIIPPFFLRAVVAIGIKSNPQDEKPSHWIGTGFLVGRPEENEKYSIYLITNRHVIDKHVEIYLRCNSKTGTNPKDYVIPTGNGTTNILYSCHPNPSVDICAIRINAGVLENDKMESDFFSLDNHALTLKQMQETGVSEGSIVYALGFPMNLVGDVKKTPICRLGCISRIADSYVDERCLQYLIDAHAFPGNSGGPVINCPEQISIEGTPHNSSANLIGILNSYIPYSDTLKSTQTGEIRSVQKENSGLTNVYPVDWILEVVEVERERSNRPSEERK